jgi:hypothetical protein
VESRHARNLRSDTPKGIGEFPERLAFKRGGDVFALRGFASRAGIAPGPRETNSESGLSGSSAELVRDLPPDNSEEAFQGVSLPPFFFSCRMNEIPTAVGACLDNKQSNAGVFQNVGQGFRTKNEYFH